jgi:hypothetical protein
MSRALGADGLSWAADPSRNRAPVFALARRRRTSRSRCCRLASGVHSGARCIPAAPPRLRDVWNAARMARRLAPRCFPLRPAPGSRVADCDGRSRWRRRSCGPSSPSPATSQAWGSLGRENPGSNVITDRWPRRLLRFSRSSSSATASWRPVDGLISAILGAGRLLVIEDPAGIGKTALIAGARGLAHGAGMQVLSGRGSEFEQR